MFMGVADWFNVGLNGLQVGWQIFTTIKLFDLMNKLTNASWLWEQAKKFCIEFDKTLIKYSDKVYNLFLQIVDGTLLTKQVIEGIMNRLYLLIGILIFFRIAITLIRYVVAPETFLDDKVGAGQLVKRIVMGMIAIAAIPLIFTLAGKLQSAILKDKIIEKTILPDYAYNTLVNSTNTGNRLAMIAFEGFFNWNSAVPSNINDTQSVYKNYSRAILRENIESIKADDVTKQYPANSGKYMIDYIPILSTAVVGYVLYTLIKYTLEIALRSFKLAFLQIISPIVIVNYMLNPGSDESMKKWISITVSTYVVMFIRVMTLWFATLMAFYLANGIPEADGGATSLISPESDPFVKAVLVIAMFVFLKELPKWLSELLGIDLQENENINGLMKQGVNTIKGFAMGKVGMAFAKQQLAANAIGSGLGAGAGIAGGVSGALKSDNFKNLSRAGKTNVLAGASFRGVGESWAPMVHDTGSAISSSMGSTILGPIAHQGSLARASYNPGDGDSKSMHEYTDTYKEKQKEPKPPKKKKSKDEEDDTEQILKPEGYNANQQTTASSNGPINMVGATVVNDVKAASPQLYNETTNSFDMSSEGTRNQVIQAVTNSINEHFTSGNVTTEQVAQVFQQNVQNMSSVTPAQVIEVSNNIVDSTNNSTNFTNNNMSSNVNNDNIIPLYTPLSDNQTGAPLRGGTPEQKRPRNDAPPLRPPQELHDDSKAA